MMKLDITGKDGTVIEKKLRFADAIPNFDDFDFKTKEGFLHDFDTLKRAILAALDKVSRALLKNTVTTSLNKTAERRISSLRCLY